jgi:hypothetical protein
MMPPMTRRRLAPVLVACALGASLAACTMPARDDAGLTHDAPPATAAPVEEPRQYRQTYELRDVQPCGDGCRYVRRGAAKVRLSVDPGGAVSARAVGALREKFDATVGKNERVTRWQLGWGGHWKEHDHDLVLRLEPTGATCDEVAADDSVQAIPCGEQKKLELTCRETALPLTGEGRYMRALVCDGKNGIDLGPALPWAFGLEHTLTARDQGSSPSLTRTYVSSQVKLPER